MPEFDTVVYERPAEHVARIVLNRPEAMNTQDYALTYDLNAAFDVAAQDDDVHVIILAGSGGNFCCGHDISILVDPLEGHIPMSTSGGFALAGPEGMWSREREIFLEMCHRWRTIPKPTIAQVDGAVIAGGLMLAWVCDLIVAADDTIFSDPVVDLNMGGVEYFGYPWEMGVRRAKEFLFTAEALSAQDALAFGMVNRLYPVADLEQAVVQLASLIAAKPTFGLRVAKENLNAAQDRMGHRDAINAAFGNHMLNHAHNFAVHGMPVFLPEGPYRDVYDQAIASRVQQAD